MRAALGLVAVVYVATLAGLEPRGFWIIDNANKWLQVEAVLESGYRDWSLHWPGSAIDPAFEFNPLPPPFGVVQDGRLFSFYPPFFPTLSSVPYRWLGFRGLVLLPLLASLVGLAGVASLACALGLRERARAGAVLVAGLATPLWFYSATFWEHAPAWCLATWAVAAWLRFLDAGRTRDLVVASALATFAVWFRDELYLFCGVLAALAAWWAPPGRRAALVPALATMALCILPLWVFQWAVTGQPLGLHVVSQWPGGLAGWLAERPRVAYLMLAAFVPSVWGSLLLALPFLAGMLAARAWSPRRFAWAVPVAAALATLACGVSLAGYWTTDSPIAWMNRTNSLFSTTPILLLAFVRSEASGHPARLARALHGLVVAYALVYVVAAPSAAASAGLHWGNRLVIVLYPLLAVLCAANLADWWRCLPRARAPALAAVGVAGLLAFSAQAGSITLLAERKDFSHRLSLAVAERPEPVIVTDLWWAPQELFAVFASKPIFLVDSREEMAELRRRLRRAGHAELLFVTSSGRETPGSLVGRVDDGGLGFFSLDLTRLPID